MKRKRELENEMERLNGRVVESESTGGMQMRRCWEVNVFCELLRTGEKGPVKCVFISYGLPGRFIYM